MSTGHFAANFLVGYLAAKNAKADREREEKANKLQTQLFALQMEEATARRRREEQQTQERSNFFDEAQSLTTGAVPMKSQHTPGYVPPGPQQDVMGPVPPPSAGATEILDPRPKMSLTELLADPSKLQDPQKIAAADSLRLAAMKAGINLPQPQEPALTFEQRRELAQAGRSPGVTVNTGDGMPKPPAGFVRPKPDQPGLQVEPGGPVDIEQRAADVKRLQKVNVITQKADNVISTIDEALPLVGFGTTGLASDVSRVKGTDAYALAAALKTIKANIGFDRLQEMRDASPTGGALGQVAVQELEGLQASIASLDQGQSPKKLRENLEKVRKHYEAWKAAVTGQGTEALPEGVPAGSVKIGTSNGNPVYQAPDGSTLIVEP